MIAGFGRSLRTLLGRVGATGQPQESPHRTSDISSRYAQTARSLEGHRIQSVRALTIDYETGDYDWDRGAFLSFDFGIEISLSDGRHVVFTWRLNPEYEGLEVVEGRLEDCFTLDGNMIVPLDVRRIANSNGRIVGADCYFPVWQVGGFDASPNFVSCCELAFEDGARTFIASYDFDEKEKTFTFTDNVIVSNDLGLMREHRIGPFATSIES